MLTPPLHAILSKKANFIVWPDVEEQVAVERAHLDQLFVAYQAVISKSSQQEPDFIELSALATMLHSFYTGLENIFKRIALEIDGHIPSGIASHSDLLIVMTQTTANRPLVISEALRTRLSAYLSFRHVFRHTYSFQLSGTKCEIWSCRVKPRGGKHKWNLTNSFHRLDRNYSVSTLKDSQ